MQFTEIKRFIENLNQLPTLSSVVFRIIETAGDEDSNIQTIAKLIESDLSLSSRVLKIANFTLCRTGKHGYVNTVGHATSVLGLNIVRSIALSLIVIDIFTQDKDSTLNLVDFWHHSTACAIASKLLAQRLSYDKPEDAFIAGLLHDLGKLIFFQWKREQYEEIIRESKAVKTRLLEIEEKHFGIGHTYAAKLLMEQWKFPVSLVSSAWLHHQPLSEFGSNFKQQLPFIVKCADSLCHIQRFGESGNPAADLDLTQLCQVIEMSSDEISEMSGEIFNLFEDVAKNFNWEVRMPDIYLSAVSRANQELFHQQIELRETQRNLTIQLHLNNIIYELQESLSTPVPAGEALKKVIDLLGDIIPYKRLIGFIYFEKETTFDGWMKLETEAEARRIIMPMEIDSSNTVNQMRLREQISLIKEIMDSMKDDTDTSAEVLKALRSPDLKVQPMYVNGRTLGLIMIEAAPFNWDQHEKTIFLRKFALAAAVELERILMFRALDQQMEDCAQLVRKAEAAQSQLYQAERLASVGRLAAEAAHEINNPLSAISLKAQLLLNRITDEKNVKDIKLILEQTYRIAKIMNDFLGMAKPVEPKIEPTDLKSVIEHTLNFMKNRFILSGVKIRKEFADDIPLVNIDSTQMEQVFLNLAINAIQAMEGGGRGILTVVLKVDRENQKLCIEFKDTGHGIPMEDIPNIFKPFFTSKRERGGTGLGLSICQSIVEGHGGDISVYSQPDQGAAFTILLPLSSKSANKTAKAVQQVSQLNPIPEHHAKDTISVLIVDDEEVIRNLLIEAFSYYKGYHVDVASDGIEAMARLDNNFYDVMILDVRMPRKGGLEVLEAIEDRLRVIPKVIVLSGVAKEDEFEIAKKAGAFACIKKPFEIVNLLRVINEAIASTE